MKMPKAQETAEEGKRKSDDGNPVQLVSLREQDEPLFQKLRALRTGDCQRRKNPSVHGLFRQNSYPYVYSETRKMRRKC